jgi:hypothetical protein
MNFKKQAEKLENFLDTEFKNKLPIAVMPDGSLVYKSFKIKKNKNQQWDLSRVGGTVIDTFNLKACAVLGAKYYHPYGFNTYNEIKNLDNYYQKNTTDAAIFKYYSLKSSDPVKKDTCLWRWEISEEKAKIAKQQIISKFKFSF